MEEFGTPNSSEKSIAILGGRWWPQAAKQEGDKIISKKSLCNIWKQRIERPIVGGVSTNLGERTVLRFQRDAGSMVK